ncbi:MAG TPA: glycosyltransferase N-terminal domain-containing protein [Bacteroidia bacterium]|nr:glycosyltransferase N-terminal domain-containing protein [Bacteroidia bacterium]
MRLLYNLSIYLYIFYVRVGSLFNAKAKLMIAGRKNIFENINFLLKKSALLPIAIGTPDSKLVWFHCASLGEFEQGRPLMEKLKLQQPNVKILLTFFSPSGYEIRKNYTGADFIFYLPMDTPSNAKKFIEIINPKKVFFVKYEFWFNYLSELKNKNIPTYLVSGIFRENHHFFKSTGAWFRKQLSSFTHFFLQDEKSMELLNSIGYTNTTLCGDTRFDRVFEVAKNAKQIDLVKLFVGDFKIMIVGSSWSEDEKIIANNFSNLKSSVTLSGVEGQNFKLIIAPHEINEKHLVSIETEFIPLLRGAGVCLRYSLANENNVKEAQVLIIDNIGMLSSLYQYGTIAFIGGGFGKGIHNILEAATFGLPVIFGPNYQKFTEAKELIKLGGAFSINDISEFEKTMLLLSDEQVLKMASQISRMYVQGRVGATEKILSSTFPK